MIVPTRNMAAKAANIKLYFDVKSSLIFSYENDLSTVLASITIVNPPIPINAKAGRSYFQFICSLRYLTARNVLNAIAVMELVDIRTRSTKGNTAI